jgi:hypothetical protein
MTVTGHTQTYSDIKTDSDADRTGKDVGIGEQRGERSVLTNTDHRHRITGDGYRQQDSIQQKRYIPHTPHTNR